MRESTNDHGGKIAQAMASFGGSREDWVDLSTGINPTPYPFNPPDDHLWRHLPDEDVSTSLELAARRFWNVPQDADLLIAPGASSLIARIPTLVDVGRVSIPAPTYNEHKSAFVANGWQIGVGKTNAKVVVNPNNPDGRHWLASDLEGIPFCIIDESFCDVTPDKSLMNLAAQPGRLVLKSFGKFWGLGGLRLGFAIGDPALIEKLRTALGPWPVSGPALAIGAQALSDDEWASRTRKTLADSSIRLDAICSKAGLSEAGGTSLFRLYSCEDAGDIHSRLAEKHILTRIFPYSKNWIRFGIPGSKDEWDRLEQAL